MVLRARHAVRLPRRLRALADLERRREDRADRSRRRRARAQPRASTSAIHGDTGIVLEQLARELRRRSSTSASGLAQVRADEDKRRAKMQPEIESNDVAAEPAARLRRARQAPRAERHRHRRRRRLRGDGGVRAQDRVAAALDGPGAARHARRRPRLRDGGEARAARRERGARLRRRQLRPPRPRVRGDGAPEHPGHRA